MRAFLDSFEKWLGSYFTDPREDYLLGISELGEEMVHAGIPPEDIAELFGEALIRLGRCFPDSTLKDSAKLISVPLMELLIAYGLTFREQAAKQRAYEESRLARSVIENTMEGIWVADLAGRFEFANPAFTDISGYDPFEKEISVQDLFVQSDVDQVEWPDAIEELKRKGVFRGELSGLRKNGRQYPAMVSLSRIRDGEPQSFMYVGVLEDISDRKEREAGLALELARAKQIYDLVIKCDLPVLPGLRMYVECLPAENVGGDTVEVHRIDDHRCLLFIADVVGHGLPAAMTANAVKMLFMELVDNYHDPAAILGRLNRSIYAGTLADDIIACFCALIDTERLTVTYTLAGLPKPVIIRGKELIELKPNGMLLGVFSEMEFKTEAVPLLESDLLVVFTDGLTEARSPDGFVLGAKRLLEGLEKGDWFESEGIIETLIGTAQKYQEKIPFSDDVIVAAIQLINDSDGSLYSPWNRFCADNRSSFSLRTKEVIFFMHAGEIVIDELIETVISDVTRRVELPPVDLARVSNALFELVTNALEHGSLEITQLKNDPSFFDTQAYWEVFKSRLLSTEFGRRKITVDCVYLSREVRITVEDEGPGFTPEHTPDPTAPDNWLKPSGRGLSMVRMCVDELEINSSGRSVTMVVRETRG